MFTAALWKISTSAIQASATPLEANVWIALPSSLVLSVIALIAAASGGVAFAGTTFGAWADT